MNKNSIPYNDLIDSDLLGEMLDSVAPQSPPPGLRMKVLSRALGTKVFDEYNTVRHDAPWRNLFPGIDFKMLSYDVTGGTKSFMLRATAGARLPAHSHSALEECLVIEGEFRVGDLQLKAGDFHCMEAGTSHKESYTASGVTVYIRSSIRDYQGVNP